MTKETLKKFILPAAIAVAAVAAIIIAVVVSSNKEEIYRLVKVKSFEGAVTVQREEKMDAFEGLQLISEDSVEVGDASLLELLADSDKHIVAEENTAFVLHSTGTEASGNITIDLLYGKSLFTIDNKLNDESTFEVKTPNATMSVRGTSFSTEYDAVEKATNVEVLDGVVNVTYDGGEMLLEKGDAVSIKVNEDEMEVVEGATLDSNDPNGGNDGTEQLFYVGMTYAQEENYAKADAEYQFGLSEYVGEKAENAELSNKIIEIVKSHSDEVNKYFESNKDLASQNKTESEDITKWFEDTISIGDKYYSVDKVVMDIAVSGSSVERDYFTSDTYKVKEKGREMYYCASGVVIEFYGEIMEAPVVTTVPETTTAVTTTTPVTTTVPETTTTVPETTTVATTTTPVTTTVATTTTAAEELKFDRIKIVYPYYDGEDDMDKELSFYFNVPSGYKLSDYYAEKYSQGEEWFKVKLVPEEDIYDDNCNLWVSVIGTDNIKEKLIKEGEAHPSRYGGFVVIDKYNCSLGTSKNGTVYIVEVGLSDDGSPNKHQIFVDLGIGMFPRIEWDHRTNHNALITPEILDIAGMDIEEFARAVFPPA